MEWERLQKKVEALRGLPPYEVRVQLTDALRELPVRSR
jgi:hypothetical protein